MHFTNLFTVLFSIVYYGRRLLYKKVMTKIKLFQLRLFRTIRRQICSIDMIDIETFTNIFRLLNQVDRSIIEKYIQGYSIKSIADESEYSKAFVSERIYVCLLYTSPDIETVIDGIGIRPLFPNREMFS